MPKKDSDITQTDIALIQLTTILFGSLAVGDPERQKGLDKILVLVCETLKKQGQIKAAALIETVRTKAVTWDSGPSTVNALLEGKKL